MADKKRLSIADFLKILPTRNKKIEGAASDPPKPLTSYRPNRLAMILHPGRQALRVAGVTPLTDDVKLYTLVPDPSGGTDSLAPFGAGSYISVTVETDGRVFSRPYSITSSPGDALHGRYEIAVKKEPGGVVSDFIHENWDVGTPVSASEPAGEFQYEPLRDAPTVICVAGGTGITPFRSMIRAVLEGSEDFRLTLIYGARTEKDLLFRREIEAAETLDPRIKVVYVLSEEEKPGREHGFVTADVIRRYAPVAGPYSVFVCGPQAMYRHLETELPKLGLRRKYIRYEIFGPIRQIDAEPDYIRPERDVFSVTVRQNGAEREIPCRRDETLLSAMERAGVRAPSLCRSGECGFCHSKLVSGDCYVPARQDHRREADTKYGYIHPCSAFPLSDVVIDVPSAK